MAKKGERQSEEVKKKISKSLIGHTLTDEARRKISKTLIGNIPWNKGRTGIYSNETRKKIGRSRLGRIPWNKGLTKETDIRMEEISKKNSENQIGRAPSINQLRALEKGRYWCKGLTKEDNNSLKRRAEKQSLTTRGRKNPKHGEFLKKFYKENPHKHPNYIIAKKRGSGAKTRIEEEFGFGLEQAGIKAEFNYPVDGFWLDYAVPSIKLGFECDGKYWHQDKDRDKRRDKKLESFGWNITRFTGSDIRNNLELCIAKVKEVMKTGWQHQNSLYS